MKITKDKIRSYLYGSKSFLSFEEIDFLDSQMLEIENVYIHPYGTLPEDYHESDKLELVNFISNFISI